MNKALAKTAPASVVQYTGEELELIRSTFAKDLAPQEFEMFKAVSRATGLNIIMRQIHAVKRGGRVTFQTAIDGFRLIAQRSHEYAGQQGPFWCGEDGEWRDVWVSDKPPVAAKVGVLRTGFAEPVWGVAKFTSYAQMFNGQLGDMWRKMPDLMIAKCAEALALRKAFPAELSGLYTSDEMMQSDNPAPAAAHSEPVNVSPAPAAAPATTSAASKLPDAARSQLVDMMDEMGWSAKKQELVFQKAVLVGVDKALDGVSKEYEKFCSKNAAEVAGPQPASATTPEELTDENYPF
jgi:phage recombination protein Bet